MSEYRIAIMGLGAIGSWLYSFLSNIPEQVELWALADARRAERLRREGILVNGTSYYPPVKTFEEEDRNLDFIFLAGKMTAYDEQLDGLSNFIGERTQIIPMQNGISSERRAAARYGRDRVIYGIARIDADRVGREVNFKHRAGEIVLGETEPSERFPDRVGILARLLSAGGLEVKLPEDIRRASWHKFMWNCSFNQWLAILDVPYGALKHSTELKALIRDMGLEVVRLAAALEVDLREADIDEMLASIDFLNDAGLPSTLQDLRAGRPTEVDELAGECLRLAEPLKLDLPLCRTACRQLKVLEAKNRRAW